MEVRWNGGEIREEGGVRMQNLYKKVKKIFLIPFHD